jgi:hypothetical protein
MPPSVGRWVDGGELKPGNRLLVHDNKRLEGDTPAPAAVAHRSR